MGSISAHREEELLVAERAADWLRRLETADAAERAAFMTWLTQSPRHVREILLATTWDKVLDTLDSPRRVDLDALLTQATTDVVHLNVPPVATADSQCVNPQTHGVMRRYRRFAGLAAAAIMLAIVAIWAPPQFPADTHTTAIGEQRAFGLEDGSMIHLNAQSEVKVNYSDEVRDLYLVDGQAIFKVKHDPARPFRVHVDGAFIQAVGTQFDVHRLTGETKVSVIEGKVRISAEEKTAPGAPAAQTAPLASLAAGESASITVNGSITPRAEVDIADATAWRQRRLVFRKQTLADIALEFNRYNHAPQIRVDAALQARRFNGVFDADDPESLIRFLEAAEDIAVDRNGREIVIRGR